jgi:competence protein ComEC
MTKIVVLDVGHGNCAVVYEGASCVVIDAGPGTALLEFMRENEIKIVEEILISHADNDHLKGVLTILDQDDITVKSVRLNSDAVKGSKQWNAMLYSLDHRNRKGEMRFEVQLVEGFTLAFFDAGLEVLAPTRYLAGKGPGSEDSEGRRITTNTISAVVRIQTPHRSVLITGDIDNLGLSHLLSTGQNLHADVLVFPHHGGHVSASASLSGNRKFAEQLLAAVVPTIVVFSISRTKYENPRPEIVDAVRTEPSRKIMCTQMSRRCLEAPPEKDGHLADVFAEGRQSGQCCAGSIVVSDAELMPSVASHTAFVRRVAPEALCVRQRA